MNTRRRMKMKWLNSLSPVYFENNSIRYIFEYNKLLKEFIYTAHANNLMRESKHFGLPNRKEFENIREDVI